jgi:replication fork protection complex subunit Tof1/Swi1
MAQSESEEYIEIANNLLLNLFYDENNLELIVSNVRRFKNQSFGSTLPFIIVLRYRFLDACTSLAHTVLKLLEQFSQDRRMYVRSKRQRPRLKNADEHSDGCESEDERTANKSVAEKAFHFTAFESVRDLF